MGEIFKAQDTRLNRIVAIKVLPSGKAGDPERRSRFLLEAQAASSLNHPNVPVVFDASEIDGHYCIAAEYVAGTNLAERMSRGRLPWREAVGIAIQAGPRSEMPDNQADHHHRLAAVRAGRPDHRRR